MKQHEEHLRRRENNGESYPYPQWENPDWRLLTPAVLFIIPTIPLFSLCPVCFLSSDIDLAVSLYFYLLYIFSHPILHALGHSWTHTYTHTHKHTRQKWEPVVALEQESVDERRPICDWMTEWFKEWRAKAVKLSVSLHRSRRWEPMPRCKRGQPDPELEALELASSFKLTVLFIVLMVFMRWSW